jgi:hypothetical protein
MRQLERSLECPKRLERRATVDRVRTRRGPRVAAVELQRPALDPTPAPVPVPSLSSFGASSTVPVVPGSIVIKALDPTLIVPAPPDPPPPAQVLESPTVSVPFTVVWAPMKDDDPLAGRHHQCAGRVDREATVVADGDGAHACIGTRHVRQADRSSTTDHDVVSGAGKVPLQPLQCATVCQLLSALPPVHVHVAAIADPAEAKAGGARRRQSGQTNASQPP